MRFILGLILVPSLAFGHAGDLLESLDVKPPTGDDPSLAIESTIGLLWAENGSDYRWVCHESITQTDSLLTPRYLRSPGGFTLATVPKAGEGREPDEVVYRSTDHCDWEPVSGLTGQVITDFALDPEAPQTVYAIANNPDDAIGNGVRISTDGGLSWTTTGFADTEHRVSSILAGEGWVWTSVVDFAGQIGWIYGSSDGGDSWQQRTLDLSEYASPPDLDLLELQDNGVWFRSTQTLKDDLWSLDLDEEQPIRLYQGETKLMSVAQHGDGRLFTVLWNEGIALYEDGEMSLIPDSPISYALRSNGVTLYAATRPLFTSQGLMTSADGLLYEDAFGYSALGAPPTCEAESHSALYCEPLWETLAARLEEASGDTGDTGDTGSGGDTDTDLTEDAKGCKKSRSGQASLLFVLPLVFRRRSRQTEA